MCVVCCAECDSMRYLCVFYVNFNVFFKLIKVPLLVSELYIYQNARCNDKTKINSLLTVQKKVSYLIVQRRL